MSFAVRLPIFEGPFDLLLFFIERDELEIRDIPIARIADEFMRYLEDMEALDIEVASEFMLTAATLMRIKAKMLLPRLDPGTDGAEADPREELARRLLAYQRMKATVPPLAALEAARAERFVRGNAPDEIAAAYEGLRQEAEWQHLSLYQLMRTFERCRRRWEEAQRERVHVVPKYAYTVEGQKEHVLSRTERGGVSFDELLGELRTRMAAVFTFLAILELLQSGSVIVQLAPGFNNFSIHRAR
ncbi:MAG: ScpA family protein [Catalinimonas sp.]